MINTPTGLLAAKGGGSSPIPTDYAVYYPFNGNANDESGNGYDGTVYGATLTTDRKGNPNSAYDFNGTSDYIDFGDIDFETFGTEFSISLWATFDILTADRTLFQATFNSDIINVLNFAKQSDSEFRLNVRNGVDNVNDSNISNNIDTTNWFHLLLTLKVNGSNLDVEIFENNVLIYTNSFALTYTDTIFRESDHFVVGSLAAGTARFHDGKLDDIRLYNRILTSEERTALYNE